LAKEISVFPYGKVKEPSQAGMDAVLRWRKKYFTLRVCEARRAAAERNLCRRFGTSWHANLDRLFKA
jgi:hypothetical protein